MGKVKNLNQKIKLKVGKRLSKGDNLTNVSFKAKKIKINYQIGGTTKSEKEKIFLLLNNLKKDPTSNKLLKLKKIRAIISVENELVTSNYYEIFNKITELILDEDAAIRRQNLALMKVILCKLPKANYSDFPLLKSLLICAMTNINTNIRLDSLKVLQLIIDCRPDIITCSHSLLNDLLRLISVQSKLGNNSIASSSRSLISPGEKTGSLDWKKSVLKCLADFLKNNTKISKPKIIENITKITIGNKVDYLVIKSYNSCSNTSKNNFSDSNDDNFNLNLKCFEEFIAKLTPILYENWLEFSPSQLSSFIGTAATYNDSEAMFIILKIICYVGEWLSRLTDQNHIQELLSANSGKEFFRKIFSNFPYSEENVHDVFVSQINFAICKVFNLFLIRSSPSLNKLISKFILGQLKIKELEVEGLTTILQLLKDFLSDDIASSDYEQHLNNLYDLYTDLSPDNECYKRIQTFFTELSVDIVTFQHLENSDALQKWWKLLPLEFINIPLEIFNETHQSFFEDMFVVCQCDSGFIESVSDLINKIIPLILSPNKAQSATAIKLLATLNPISKEHFIFMAKVLRDKSVTSDLIETLFDALASRCQEKNSGFTLKDFLSFIVNLTFNPEDRDDEEEEEYITFDDLMHCVPFGLSSSYTIVPDLMKSHKDITMLAINQLCLIPDQEFVHSFVQQYLHLFLQKSRVIPIKSALVALKFAWRFLSYPSSVINPEEFLFQFGDFTMACHLFVIAAKTACHNNKELDIDWQNTLKDLKEYTLDVGQIFKVIFNMSSAINSPNYLFCTGQLLMQLLSVDNFRSKDIIELVEIMKVLKTKYGKKLIEQNWWLKVCKFLQYINSE